MAEDPVMLGLRGALRALAPVPTETSKTVRTMAAEMLARHVKQHKGASLSQRESGGSRVWMEMKDLRLTHVTANAVSQADKANGKLESYMVSVDCEMYRTYDQAAAKWSDWSNGKNPFMPAVIYVERQTNEQWIARMPTFPTLIAQYSRGDPNSIPHGSQAAPKPPLILANAPKPVPKPAQAIKTTTVPGTANPINTTTNSPSSWKGIVVLLTIIVGFGAFLNSVNLKKPRRRSRNSRRSGKSTPPPLNFQAVNLQPPPLPSYALVPDSNPIDLIRRKENLMTPAEQAFFAVLEPIVRSSCMVSSKVRLADLFDVRQERGQQAAFNKICSKHIDFVLTDPGSSRILCGIELDDSSHSRPDRIERDTFVNELFAASQLPLMRVPVAWTYYPQALRTELLKAGVSLSNVA